MDFLLLCFYFLFHHNLHRVALFYPYSTSTFFLVLHQEYLPERPLPQPPHHNKICDRFGCRLFPLILGVNGAIVGVVEALGVLGGEGEKLFDLLYFLGLGIIWIWRGGTNERGDGFGAGFVDGGIVGLVVADVAHLLRNRIQYIVSIYN